MPRPLLIVMNPRRIPECVDAIDALSIDKVWVKNYTERELVDVIADIIANAEHDPIGIISDDARPDQAALDLVVDAYEPGAVYTGYCNLSEHDYRVNLSTQPLTIQFEATMDCYTFITKDELEAEPDHLIRSWFAGLLLGLVEALGTGYIGEYTDLCRWPGAADGGWMGERCADGAHFVLFGSNYQDVFAFLMLILVLVFRPSGLLGERVSERA